MVSIVKINHLGGKATLAELWDDFCKHDPCRKSYLVPPQKGIYCIYAPLGMEINFKDTIDNHPGDAYRVEDLESKRVSSDILYIGKASGKRGLFQRLRQYMRYGFDTGNNHRGGRAIFQIVGYEQLICEWYSCEQCEAEEHRLLEDFKHSYGTHPVANWRK